MIGRQWHRPVSAMRQVLGPFGTARDWLDRLTALFLVLILAMLVWLVANERERPMTSASFPSLAADEPRIEFRNVPAGWAVFEPDVRSVALELRGITTGVQAMRPADFAVSADLRAVDPEAGAATVPLAVRCRLCRRRGVRVAEVRPPEVALRLSRVVSQTEAVVLAPLDDLPEGYRIGSQVIVPTHVILNGAMAPMSRVLKVVAQVGGLSEVRGRHTFTGVTVVALDASGQVVPDVQVTPALADVTVWLRSRGEIVAVVPDVRGQDAVASGYFFAAVWVEPKLVELDGPPDAIRTLGNDGRVYTEPLNLENASDSVRRRMTLLLPEGVTALNAADGVTVTVEIEALPGTVTLDVLVIPRRLADGLVADITPDHVQVLLSGPQPDLERITTEGLTVYVDLVGLGSGGHRVPVEVASPPNVRVRSATPEEVQVTVRPAAAIGSTPAATAPAGR